MEMNFNITKRKLKFKKLSTKTEKETNKQTGSRGNAILLFLA